MDFHEHANLQKQISPVTKPITHLSDLIHNLLDNLNLGRKGGSSSNEPSKDEWMS